MSHHSQYAPTISDRIPISENEVKEMTKRRSELKAQLRPLLKIEQAAYKQAVVDLEEGELFDPEYIYIQGPSKALELNSESKVSSRSKVCYHRLNTCYWLIDERFADLGVQGCWEFIVFEAEGD